MLYKHKLKFLPIFMVVAMLVATAVINVSNAASIIVMSDTMTDQTVSVASNHVITTTLPATISFDIAGSSDVLTYNFPETSGFTTTGTWATTDFAFNDGTARTILTVTAGAGAQVADCTGTAGNNDVAVTLNTTTLVFAVTPCGTYAASAAPVTVIFTINGTTPDGALLNPSVASSASVSYVTALSMDDEGVAAVCNPNTAGHCGSISVPIITDGTIDITATVAPTLTFAIRNFDDDAAVSTCALGTLTADAVSICRYRIAVDTNATSGYTVLLQAGAGLVSGSDEIDAVVEGTDATKGNDTVVTLGYEEYGIAVVGATTGAAADPVPTYTEEGNFNDDDTPLPTTQTELFSINRPADYTALTLTDSTLVTHRAAISAVTPAGSYTQTVTYTVVGNF
jgi:hypothetical protein